MLRKLSVSNQQSRGTEQNQRQSGLGDDQRLLRPPRGVRGGTMRSAQSICGVGVRCHPGGRNSEENPSQYADRERESEHRQRRQSADGNFIALKCEPQDKACAGEGKSDTHDSAEESKNRALGQHLPYLP
jgi:hypothetical protein